MAKLVEYPQSGNLVEREPIREELEKKYLEAKKAFSNPNDGFSKTTPEELYYLGQRILKAQNIWAAYDILAEPSKSDLPYYDLVIGPQHFRAIALLKAAIEKSIPSRVKKGLDIGAGTGMSTLTLVTRCEEVTAVDLNPNLLNWARARLNSCKKRREIENYQVLVMNALNLEFPPDTFDVVIAHGLDPYLTPDEINRFYQEVGRVLIPGGGFFQYSASLPPNHPVYTSSPRAELAGVVAKALLSFTYAPFYNNPTLFLFPPEFPFSITRIPVFNSPYNEEVICLTKIKSC